MALFSTAILGVAVGATNVMRANQTSHFHTIATTLAQDQLEFLKTQTEVSLPDCDDLPTLDPANCSNNSQTLGTVFTRQWQITEDPTIGGATREGVTQITVRVTWTDYADQNVTISSAVPRGAS
jgi:hypothetical protein